MSKHRVSRYEDDEDDYEPRHRNLTSREKSMARQGVDYKSIRRERRKTAYEYEPSCLSDGDT